MNVVLFSILGEVFILFQYLSTWQIIMVVVFPILMSASATFLITMFTLMCWRKHKRKSLKSQLKYVYDFVVIITISVSSMKYFEIYNYTGEFDRNSKRHFRIQREVKHNLSHNCLSLMSPTDSRLHYVVCDFDTHSLCTRFNYYTYTSGVHVLPTLPCVQAYRHLQKRLLLIRGTMQLN